MAWKPIKGSVKFYPKSMSYNFKMFSSSTCPSLTKTSSLWSCKNGTNKTMMSVSTEGEKIVTLLYEPPLIALHGVLFWFLLICETFLMKIQFCYFLTDSNLHLFVLWYTLVVAQLAWLYFHCFFEILILNSEGILDWTGVIWIILDCLLIAYSFNLREFALFL